MKNILVTGCLGTIGIFTTRELIKNGYNVIGVDNCSASPIERLKEIPYSNRFVFYNNTKEKISNIFKYNSIDCVLHLASYINIKESLENYQDYQDNHIGFTTELLEFSKKYRIRRFIFASSYAVYGETEKASKETDEAKPLSVYGVTKYTAELLVKQYDMESICLRYYNTFAPIKYHGYKNIIPKFTEMILANKPVTLFNNGVQKKQFVPVENIAYANFLAIDTKNEECFGESFNVSVEEEPISIKELTYMLYDKLKTERSIIYNNEMPYGDTFLSHGDISKAKKMLGYTVQKEMKQGIDDYIGWVLK